MPPAARLGDMHVCPMVTPGLPPIPHVGGPILPACVPTVLIGGEPAATVTCMAFCVASPPDVIVKGSSGVFINSLPAARVGDMTAHGGVIVVGCPTVIIGETGAGGGGAAGAAAIKSGLIASMGDNPIAAIASRTNTPGTFLAQLATAAKAPPPPPPTAKQTLIAAQNAAIANPAYQPSGGVTHCNQATTAIARASGMNTAGILTDAYGTPYLANQQIANLASPNSGFHAVSPDEAQQLADNGTLVFATQQGNPHGHITTVRPDDVDEDPELHGSGPVLANVGATNGVGRQSNFMTPRHGDIVYYAPDE